MKRSFVKRTEIAAPQDSLFKWHELPGAFRRLKPPFETIQIIKQNGGIKNGDTVKLRAYLGPFFFDWELIHQNYHPPEQFQDVQVKGPFKNWSHKHLFIAKDENFSFLEDRIEYEMPFGLIGDWLGNSSIEKKLKNLFEYRHRITKHDVAVFHRNNEAPMKILLTGSSGLVGKAVNAALSSQGHEVIRLVRNSGQKNSLYWNPDAEQLNPEQLEGFDAVIHLAGETVAQRWTEEKKIQIHESRVKGTQLLCKRLAELKKPPKVLIAASAIGFYGDRGAEPLTENNQAGSGFLAEVCQDWEDATLLASKAGIRTVNLRIGVVMSADGGALAKMLPPFSMGAGGTLGSGKQYMSWIAIDDLVQAIYFAINNSALNGPVNAVSPNPVTNAEFTSALGKALSRPAICPIPPFAVRLIFGQMADEMLLGGAKILPSKLQASGFQFSYPEIEPALRHVLGKTN